VIQVILFPQQTGRQTNAFDSSFSFSSSAAKGATAAAWPHLFWVICYGGGFNQNSDLATTGDNIPRQCSKEIFVFLWLIWLVFLSYDR